MRNLHKIQASGLTGRGGAEFPVSYKWLSVLKAKIERFDEPVYVICNATEGEPGVDKDKYLIQYHPAEVVNGIKIAIDELGAEKAYVYCQRKDMNKFKARLSPYIGSMPISFFPEDGGYLCGEETTLLETMEGNRPEPRLKPPFPTESGLKGHPTLVNNVETFYFISKLIKGEYHDTRFYSIHGDVPNPGIFELSAKLPIREVLRKTKNSPRSKFFVQVGGGAAGQILMPDELGQVLCGAGSIIVYNAKKTKSKELMKRWVNFFYNSNCGKCAPCREGLYRLKQELKKQKPDWLIMRAVLETMRDSSFCPLGKSVHEPMMSLITKVGVE